MAENNSSSVRITLAQPKAVPRRHFTVPGGNFTPVLLDLENSTLANENYRRVLWTGERLQIVMMSLGPGETIDTETHYDADQFIRVESGGIRVKTRSPGSRVPTELLAVSGQAVVIPAGTQHTVYADTADGAQLYTIYAPPQHPPGRIQKYK